MYKELPPEKFYHLINHGPCVIISSRRKDGEAGRTNIAPIAWYMPLNDDPPLVAIALGSTNYTTELIDKQKEFAINIPDIKLLTALVESGKISGRQTDKIKKFGVQIEKSKKISTPHIKDIIGWIECKVLERKEYDGVVLFVGKVVYCAVNQNAYTDESGLEPSAMPTAHHLGGKWFGVIEKKIPLW